MKEYKPTFLYIKRHTVTGLMYFGKTNRKVVENYVGSGKYWTRHIKKHGRKIETLWYCLFTDKEELVKFAAMFSEQQGVGNSPIWANLIPEDGLCGNGRMPGINYFDHTPESRAKISAALTGRKRGPYRPRTAPLTEETKAKMRAGQQRRRQNS